MAVITKVMRTSSIRNKVYRVQKFDGEHKEICICHQGCKFFKPDNEEENCSIAQIAFAASKLCGIVLVHSCSYYEKKEEKNAEQI